MHLCWAGKCWLNTCEWEKHKTPIPGVQNSRVLSEFLVDVVCFWDLKRRRGENEWHCLVSALVLGSTVLTDRCYKQTRWIGTMEIREKESTEWKERKGKKRKRKEGKKRKERRSERYQPKTRTGAVDNKLRWPMALMVDGLMDCVARFTNSKRTSTMTGKQTGRASKQRSRQKRSNNKREPYGNKKNEVCMCVCVHVGCWA